METTTVPTPLNRHGAPGGEALQAVLNASALLLKSSSIDAVLASILDLAREAIAAEAYAVWRARDSGRSWQIVASQGLSSSYRTELRIESPMQQVYQAVSDVMSEPSLAIYRDEYAREGIRSLLAVPMISEGETFGTITFYWHKPRTFSDLDLTYASALANLSAIALNISELHAQNGREKLRLSFLAEASEVLASSLDYEVTLQRVAHLAVPHIADWCSVHIVENGVPTRLVVAHSDPAQLAIASEFSQLYPEQIRAETGLGGVLRTGKSEVFQVITDPMIVAAARDEEHLRRLRELQLSSSILVPLTSRGKVLGAIRFLATGGARFDADDLQLAEDLARRAASAVDNAHLHRAVIEQENNLRLSHSAARMGSWTLDLLHGQPFWSNEFKVLHGLPVDFPASTEAGQQLIHPDDRAGVLRELSDVIASSADQLSFEHRVVAADGRLLWIHARGRIHRDATGKAVSISGISMDVTERRLAEDALRRTEKLAAAGRLAATVAHEVNNPLEALMNLVYLCQGTPGLPDEAREHLRVAEGELIRMAHIVRQTLGFYRESATAQPALVSVIVSEVLSLYRAKLSAKDIRLSIEADPDVYATVISGEIKQVIANLISNALDATDPGGRISIRVVGSGNAVTIIIEDTGAGILEADQSHLFEAFFTTKSDVGTGLGLWVSKGIIEKHGGSIEFRSDTSPEHHGTRFTISLPSAGPKA